MAITDPRDRIVTFRLSSAEYQSVASTSETTGSRSISDFSREAVLVRVAQHRQTSERDRVRSLQEESKRLIQTLFDLNEKFRLMTVPSPDHLEEPSDTVAEVLMLKQLAGELAHTVMQLANEMPGGAREKRLSRGV